MMASRGKPKPNIRDLSRQSPSREEALAVLRAFASGPPIVTAILGQSLIEHELEQLLRGRFKRGDDDTWQRLTGNDGPLGTFSAKITAGYAFKLYDESMRKNLDTVRLIRNAFAHSKRLIDFDDKLILNELKVTALPSAKTSRRAKDIKLVRSLKSGGRASYIVLCQRLFMELIKRSARGYAASSRNLRRKIRRLQTTNPFAAALLSFPSSPTAAFQAVSAGHQTFGPTVHTVGPLTLASLAATATRPRNKDKSG
jgi:hypothetical protein